VARKQFSCREYLLPQLKDEGRESYYTGNAIMLVRIRRNKRDRRWYGDLTQQPPRSADTLASAVDQAGGSLLAVLADKNAHRVELRPGVICELGRAVLHQNVRQAGRGALVRIDRVGEELRVVLAQRPVRYIPPRLSSPPPCSRSSGQRRTGTCRASCSASTVPAASATLLFQTRREQPGDRSAACRGVGDP
jgi:hypothetical protein